MKDGVLKLNFETGKITSVAVGAGLCSAFERLFRAAESEVMEKGHSVEIGIRVVVFGCMWIEALCNEYLPQIISASGIPDRAAASLWAGFERGSPLLKLDAIAAFDTESPSGGGDWLLPLKRAFELRNSLVHFRDKEIRVAGPVTIDEVAAHFDALPEAVLVVQLKPPDIQQVASAINDAGSRLRVIFRMYRPGDERIL